MPNLPVNWPFSRAPLVPANAPSRPVAEAAATLMPRIRRPQDSLNRWQAPNRPTTPRARKRQKRTAHEGRKLSIDRERLESAHRRISKARAGIEISRPNRRRIQRPGHSRRFVMEPGRNHSDRRQRDTECRCTASGLATKFHSPALSRASFVGDTLFIVVNHRLQQRPKLRQQGGDLFWRDRWRHGSGVADFAKCAKTNFVAPAPPARERLRRLTTGPDCSNGG